jgi:hypothetical protein
MDTIGIVGGILFFVKILMQLYIESSYEKVSTHVAGLYINFRYFLPIGDRVPPKYKTLKLVTNIMYGVSVIYIIIFLIGVNTGQINDE